MYVNMHVAFNACMYVRTYARTSAGPCLSNCICIFVVRTPGYVVKYGMHFVNLPLEMHFVLLPLPCWNLPICVLMGLCTAAFVAHARDA